MRLERAFPSRGVAALALAVGLGVAAPPANAATEAASTFEVSGKGLHVTYSSAGPDGTPRLTFASATQTLRFHGDEIRIVESADAGTFVSVTIRRTVDAGSTSFTLVIPRVELPDPSARVPVQALGITTTHRFSVIPARNRGQLDSYSAVTLTGTAYGAP